MTFAILLALAFPPSRFPLPRQPYEMPACRVYFIGVRSRRPGGWSS